MVAYENTSSVDVTLDLLALGCRELAFSQTVVRTYVGTPFIAASQTFRFRQRHPALNWRSHPSDHLRRSRRRAGLLLIQRPHKKKSTTVSAPTACNLPVADLGNTRGVYFL